MSVEQIKMLSGFPKAVIGLDNGLCYGMASLI